MWKRDEAVRTPQPAPTPSTSKPQEPAAPRVDATRKQEKDNVNIGKSIIITGDLTGSEDLTIEGQVEGKIELRQNVLTIGPNGKIKAQIFAKTVVVLGEVQGHVAASERIDIRDTGSVDGDLVAPRIAIADGAHFCGSVDMQKSGGRPPTASPSTPGQSTSSRPALDRSRPSVR